jgi:phosphoribosylanthranilate isomerase
LKTWIKICGTTNLVDALAAAQAGVDALGFIFAESPRRVEPQVAGEIAQELPPNLEKIGVFVNESPEYVLQVAKEAALTGVQLHGDESPDYIKTLVSILHIPLKIIKAIPAEQGKAGAPAQYGAQEELVDAFMVDSGTRSQRGGTGKVFDWLRASDLILGLQATTPVIIAGGLTPENVSSAVCLFRPFGVDVVTGVEREPGHKDHEKVRRFIASVRSADCAGSERKQ